MTLNNLRTIKMIIIFLSIVSVLQAGSALADQNPPKKAAMIIAHRGFDDLAFLHTRNTLVDHRINIAVVSSKKGTAKGTYLRAPVNLRLNKLKVSDFDIIIILGGKGVKKEFYKSKRLRRIVQQAAKQSKYVAAIGTAQKLLVQAKLIGPEITYPTVSGRNVIVEGKTILGEGPPDSQFFIDTIIKTIGASKPNP